LKKAIKITGKVINALLIAILMVLLVYNLYVLVARIAFKQQLPKVFGVGVAVVVSDSMRPNLNSGDLIVVKEQDTYIPNDVITFKYGNIINTHRLLREEDGFYITQGDANTNIDDPIPPQDVEGKVVAVVPKLGLVINFIQSPIGLIVLVIAGAAIVFLPSIITKGKKEKTS